MSDYYTLRADAALEVEAQRLDREMPDTCACGLREWNRIGRDNAYGADADGRRGTPLQEWECPCGNVVTTG